ncbi:virulence RhuM family protein [Thermomonas sp.]|uniref:virulence RhuM family protein n=1 Tax=Thermomonas sp. TaxID=1971895 RepID=UPI002487C04D|nr:virulence RhuM family protein [Thermomonas sp.]MDI1252413.1 virulence RhuM family protein [Thermomonas sp.]
MSTDGDEATSASELILYRTADARTRIDVRLESGSVWLTQAQMAELFETTPQNITGHLKAIYGDGEIDEAATCKHYLQVRDEGGRPVRRELRHYSLDAILAVGYRVRSARGVQFRQWATERLKEYLVKGFTMDDARLKRGPDDGYFEELLSRIRDIRSSERMFWRKVLDIYATSVDYDGSAQASQRFFKTIQNKMHWAAHGHTAAEIVSARADADKPHMGMTSWSAARPRKVDAAIAKNYLNAEELEALNRIVNAYLEFAELQALNRRPMTMQGWIGKLDDFLRLGERDILTHAGRISHDSAMAHVETQFDLYRQQQAKATTAVEHDFDVATTKLKQIKAGKRSPARKKSDTKAGDTQ